MLDETLLAIGQVTNLPSQYFLLTGNRGSYF